MKITSNKRILITILMSILFLMLLKINAFAAETFTLTSESVNVYLNQSKHISHSGGDYSQDIIWESEDPTIATVNEDGKVTGLKIGTTTITATRGDETASCEVNVVYFYMSIGANQDDSVTQVNLVLNEHETENLYATVTDYDSNNITEAQIEWISSDSSIVTVEKETGVLKAVKVGTATITATAAGVTDTCEVTVSPASEFTDFSNAKYELLFDINTDLKISGIMPKENGEYVYIITSTNQKPSIALTKYGGIDYEQENLESFILNTEEKYMYDRDLDKYVELNQELYLWVIEEVKLENSYYTENKEFISYTTKFVVEGQKLTRPELPQLNLILKYFDIFQGGDGYKTTTMNFRFPSATENRKFTVKIGKVTDNDILKKIQNNDYSGITGLLDYAKNNNAVFSTDLTTTSRSYYRKDELLFDGKSLLTDDAYYYIYIVFDDENGKYYPIQGVTLAQANIREYSDAWWLYGYTSEEFQWNNLSSTPVEPTEPPKDTTTAPTVIPNAGSKMMLVITIVLAVSGLSIVFYKKSKKLRDII